MYLEESMSTEEIARHIGLSSRQVSRLLYKNRSVLKMEKEWEKLKRKHWLKRQIKKRGDSCKDSADLLEQLRREDEEKKGINITNVVSNVNSNDETQERREAARRIFLEHIR